MGVTKTTTTVWKCDRCGVEKEGARKPNRLQDAWAHLKLDQDVFDYQGNPAAPRMREPVLLCGSCTEDVVRVLNAGSGGSDG